jgi:putative membrane protein
MHCGYGLILTALTGIKKIYAKMELIDEKNMQTEVNNLPKKSDNAKDNTDMAVERTIMAADRSLMAWVRTGLSLISFGFTIYKFLEYQQQQIQASGREVLSISGPRIFGLLMIGLGILSLIFGAIENVSTVNYYHKKYGIKRKGYSLIITGIITIIGIVFFAGIIFKIKGIV